MNQDGGENRERWARFRFAVIGPLLASPPERGELDDALAELARRTWQHPIDGGAIRFGRSTLERWYYQARRSGSDPVGALRRRVRRDAGAQPSMSEAFRQVLEEQYRQHRSWTVQLHADNLAVVVDANPALGALPSYSTILRYMRRRGLKRQRRGPSAPSAAWLEAQRRHERLEIRSYERAHAHALWHLDFHEGSRAVLTASGEWVKPKLMGIVDDHSRLCCHLQWYFEESAECLVHALVQAIQKRALPRALMTDNGAAMRAGEFLQGLTELGITHEPTLAYSAYQNGKQEVFWGQIEGRLLPMLENVADLGIEDLNEATLAWVEQEYHRKPHDELNGQSPLERYLNAPNVGRPCEAAELREKFRLCERRRQRQSDATVIIEGQRFEIPSAYRHISKLSVRYARWDLSFVHLYDERERRTLCRIFPLDKRKNADGRRRLRDPQTQLPEIAPSPSPPNGSMAPLLRRLIDDYRACGLPPAYVPHRNDDDDHDEEDPS
jgi:putative transposase